MENQVTEKQIIFIHVISCIHWRVISLSWPICLLYIQISPEKYHVLLQIAWALEFNRLWLNLVQKTNKQKPSSEFTICSCDLCWTSHLFLLGQNFLIYKIGLHILPFTCTVRIMSEVNEVTYIFSSWHIVTMQLSFSLLGFHGRNKHNLHRSGGKKFIHLKPKILK